MSMNRNILPPLRRIETPSSSSPGKVYETLVFQDGSTSCNCPGWTRRVAPDKTRSCKHTIAALAGCAGLFPGSTPPVKPFSKPPVKPVAVKPPVKPVVSTPPKPAADERIKRRFAFD
jgi:hypothetical protein